jgi:hypothetical protein
MTSDLESINKSRMVVLMAKLGQTSLGPECIIAEKVLAEKPVEKVPSVEESTKGEPSLYIPPLEEPALYVLIMEARTLGLPILETSILGVPSVDVPIVEDPVKESLLAKVSSEEVPVGLPYRADLEEELPQRLFRPSSSSCEL